MVAAEMAFGVKFVTAEVEQFKNVGDLIDSIAAKLEAK
jgi:acyl carrier protein